MKFNTLTLTATLCAIASVVASPAALAQAKEQFCPCSSYRTGPTRRTACRGPTASSTTSSSSTHAAASTA